MKSWFFVASGLALIVAAAVTALDTASFMRSSVRADGRVVALNAGGSHPQIEFRLPDGRTVSKPEGGWIAGYRVGDRVQVRYQLQNRSGASVKGETSIHTAR